MRSLPLIGWGLSRVLHARGFHSASKFCDYTNRFIFSCWIPGSASIGAGVVLGYQGLGIVVHKDAVIGDDVHIDQGVTIGGNANELGVPIIEDGVYLGAGAKILGPIRIGGGARIGANAVVLCDVPARATAVGVPARIILN